MGKWHLLLCQLTRSFLLAWTMLTLSGCTTLSVPDMLPERHKETLVSTSEVLRIGQVSGSEVKTDVMLRSVAPSGTITPPVFADTLIQALENSGIFARVVQSGASDLQLDANLVSQEISVGFPMTCTLLVHYRLTDAHNGQTKWEKSIVSIGKSPASEGFHDRQKLANERAVKENLRKLLIDLSSVMTTAGS